MDWLRDLTKGYVPSLAVGIGMALLAPVILPAAAAILRPLMKGAVKGVFTMADTLKEVTASTGEQLSDLYAEAKSEHYSKMTK
jgi:Protein of unknown function (DUF5132)